MWKFLPLLLVAAHLQATALPPNLAESLKTFRPEGPRGWSFTQTSTAGATSLVETFDATQPEFKRWNLIRKNGRAPTEDELKAYQEGKTRRSGGLNAPRLQDQLDLDSARQLDSGASRVRWQFRLKPGGGDDKAALYMRVSVTFHLPSLAVEEVEIANEQPFSPVLGVKVAENRTVMSYSLPSPGQPSLLQKVTLHLRGRAFWFKSLDENMVIHFSNYKKAEKN